jgi:hypothetical protein
MIKIKSRLALHAVMLAYLRPDTLLALALDTVVVADAGAPAYLAHAPHAVMLAYLRPLYNMHTYNIT